MGRISQSSIGVRASRILSFIGKRNIGGIKNLLTWGSLIIYQHQGTRTQDLSGRSLASQHLPTQSLLHTYLYFWNYGRVIDSVVIYKYCYQYQWAPFSDFSDSYQPAVLLYLRESPKQGNSFQELIFNFSFIIKYKEIQGKNHSLNVRLSVHKNDYRNFEYSSGK